MDLAPTLAAWSRLGAVDRPAPPTGRRFVVVHLDGVSRRALDLALRAGLMPTLSRWLNEGSHALLPTVSGMPASTPAFQAALFYGDRGDCPGYSWFDKRRGKSVRMDDAREVLRFENALRERAAGILRGGSTYFSILGGEAEEPSFSMRRLALGFPFGGKDDPQKNGWDRLATWLAHALPLARSLARGIRGAPERLLDSLAWSLEKGTARHEPRCLLQRFVLADLGQEFTTWMTVLDVCRGVPAIYAVFAGYDEVAHRRGPYAPAALAELAAADRALARIAEAIRLRPEFGYELFVLSDHGQEATRPAERVLHGVRLADWILAGGPTSAQWTTPSPGADADPLHRVCGARLLRGGGEAGRPPLVVVEAGDLAHVYFRDRETPHDLPSLARRWPAELRATLACPAAGMVLVRGGRCGFAFVRGRRIDLAEPASLRGLIGYDTDLLGRFLREMIATPSAGDLVVLGAGVPGGDVAFAWEFGSHGGVGTGGVKSFFIHPTSLDLDHLRGSGPIELHAFFRSRYLGAPDHGGDL